MRWEEKNLLDTPFHFLKQTSGAQRTVCCNVMGLQKICHVLSPHRRHLSLSRGTLISLGPMFGSQQHPPEALEGQGEGKAAGPVQWAVILFWFVLSAWLFQVLRLLLIHELESPASELRDHTDAGAAATPAGSGRWPCQTHIDDRMSPHFFPWIKDHYLSFLCIPTLDRKGLFQDCSNELLQSKHVGVLFVCLGARCPVAGMPAGMLWCVVCPVQSFCWWEMCVS